MSNITTIGTILRGRHKSNPDARAKVWAINPTNPKRVCLWMKSGKFSWNNATSLETNYEPAPTDEPTWPDPVRPCPPDYADRAREVTPVERVAAAEVVTEPAVTTHNPDPEPPPPPRVEVVLEGQVASALLHLVAHLTEALRGTGARITPASLVEDLIEREASNVVGKKVAA